MTPLFKKLQWKGASPTCVLNAPEEFGPEMAAMAGVAEFFEGQPPAIVEFLIGFAQTLAEVEAIAQAAAEQTSGDAAVWCAYPKASSKRIKCEFNRDTGWAALGKAGFEPVSQVSLSEDWSALRFRRVEFIKKMTRGFAMTEEGKRKSGTSM